MSNINMPSIFISHGSPMLAIEQSPAGKFLDGLGASLGRPRVIVIASAHYENAGPAITVTPQPETIHDFGGFPPALYTLQYPAVGDALTGSQVARALEDAGFPVRIDTTRGLDHGSWVPLMRMYPDADIPVIALSVDSNKDAAWHYAVGRALAPLRSEGVLIVGSGGFSHNLRELDWHGSGSTAASWMLDFTDPLRNALLSGDVDTAINWKTLPHAMRNHPSPEHLMPLYVALGAAGEKPEAKLIHDSIEMGSLALDAFAFRSASEALQAA